MNDQIIQKVLDEAFQIAISKRSLGNRKTLQANELNKLNCTDGLALKLQNGFLTNDSLEGLIELDNFIVRILLGKRQPKPIFFTSKYGELARKL